MKLSVTDETGKTSNEISYSFTVNVVPPSMELKNGDANVATECKEAKDIVPRSTDDLPTISGGCLPAKAFARPPSFTDVVEMDISTKGCSGYSVLREWTITPPDPSALNDTEQYDDPECTAELVALGDSLIQTFNGIPCEEDPSPIPDVCRESIFRIEGYEDFVEDGFPVLKLLPSGRESFFIEEYLLDSETAEIAEVVYANGEAIYEKKLYIVEGSMRYRRGGLEDFQKVSPLVEDIFDLISRKGGNQKKGSIRGIDEDETQVPVAPSPSPSNFPRPMGPPKDVTFVAVDPDGSTILGECEGDCDNDSDCGLGLHCFHRNEYYTDVPGCLGGRMDATLTDYCAYREIPSSSSKPSKKSKKHHEGPFIQRSIVPPLVLREYGDLCESFVVLELEIGKERGHLCFHTVCNPGGSFRSNDADDNQSRRRMDELEFQTAQESQQHVKKAICEKLKKGPRVTTFENGSHVVQH